MGAAAVWTGGRRDGTRVPCRLLLAAVLACAWLCLLGTTPPAAAAESAASAAATSGPDPVPATAATITVALSETSVVYGSPVTASGAVVPAAEGATVTITLGAAQVASAVTDADGRFAAGFTPERGGPVMAAVSLDGAASEPVELVVKPHVAVTASAPVPFLTLTYVVRVTPASYGGLVTTTVLHHDVEQTTVSKRASGGVAEFRLPLWGVGAFRLRSALASADGLGERLVARDVTATTKRLAVGAGGAHVRGVLTALQRLKIRVPSVGTTLTRNRSDAVVAFQKAYRLPRTYVIDADDWRRLDTAKPVKPRYAGPYDHLEVDKTRQILMMVRDGKLRALIAVSTGATDNTPEGRFVIQQKHPSTTSLSGGASLYRTMGFFGNFAIHGYAPVPPYPASHGCVREPMWVADWVYDRTALGERVYIYD